MSTLSSQKGSAGQPAHEVVYQELRSRVLFGELAPGQAVTILGITEELGAGMTPVREAIRRMIAEGALEMQGNRRVCVPLLSPDCVEQLDFMRQTLEPQLARLAMVYMDDGVLAELRGHDDALNLAIETGDIRGYLMHNYRFHRALYAAANAPILAETVDRLWLRFGPSLRVVSGKLGTMSLPDKHADLLTAVAAGDIEAAASAIAEDAAQGMRLVKAALPS